MHLREYLLRKSLSQAAFGRLLTPPVSQGKVCHWLEGRRRVSLIEGLQVLRLTEGEVSLQELAAMYQPPIGGEDSSASDQSLVASCAPVHQNAQGAL